MLTYWLVEEVRGNIFEKRLDTAIKHQALDDALEEWQTLTEGDRNRRSEFYLMLAYENEYGEPDYDGCSEVIDLLDSNIKGKTFADEDGIYRVKSVKGLSCICEVLESCLPAFDETTPDEREFEEDTVIVNIKGATC